MSEAKINVKVTNLAGSIAKEGSNDGKASDAKFNEPNGIVLIDEQNGTLLVGDNWNHAIRRVSADGVVQTVITHQDWLFRGMLKGQDGALWWASCGFTDHRIHCIPADDLKSYLGQCEKAPVKLPEQDKTIFCGRGPVGFRDGSAKEALVSVRCFVLSLFWFLENCLETTNLVSLSVLRSASRGARKGRQSAGRRLQQSLYSSSGHENQGSDDIRRDAEKSRLCERAACEMPVRLRYKPDIRH
jgi:hypothetical protein